MRHIDRNRCGRSYRMKYMSEREKKERETDRETEIVKVIGFRQRD